MPVRCITQGGKKFTDTRIHIQIAVDVSMQSAISHHNDMEPAITPQWCEPVDSAQEQGQADPVQQVQQRYDGDERLSCCISQLA